MHKKVFIVAEIGINHDGDIGLARELVDAAKRSGADAVKFQTFLVDEGHSSFYKSAKELAKERRQELRLGDFLRIKAYCDTKKIIFFSTPFDAKSVDILEKVGVPFYKIASPELVNIPLLRAIARQRKPVIISTGMADFAEIKRCACLFHSYFRGGGTRLSCRIKDSFRCFDTDLILLHCVSTYPPEFKTVNLNCIRSLKTKFPYCEVGFSDHTLGVEMPIAAIALGASLIEKHFTLDRSLAGPDHKFSMLPGEFSRMVTAIRNTEAALGDGLKKVLPEESRIKKAARKSIVASRAIEKGEIIDEDAVSIKRPGLGISPIFYDWVLGRKARRRFKKDEYITWKGIAAK